MPNIKGIKTDKDGNVVITPISGIDKELVRTDVIKVVEDKDIGLTDKTEFAYDVYTHCFEDLTKVNTKRTATLVCNKGYVPTKEWWITEEIEPIEVVING